MKFKNYVLGLLIACTLSSAAANEHNHQHSEQGVSTGEYDSLYFSESSLEDLSFEYRVFKDGEEVLTNFGNSDHPYTAFARVSDNRVVEGAFRIEDIRSAFAETQQDVEDAVTTKRLIGANADMIFLAGDGVTVVDSAAAKYVIIPNVLKHQISSLVNVKWNECSHSAFTGNYSGFKCSKNRGMNDNFKKFLGANIVKCVNKGLSAAGKGSAKGVHIVHGGVACDGNHNKRSLHCAMRAIDIRTLIMTQKSGKKLTADYRKAKASSKSWERKFYHNFGACWSASNVARDSRCKSRRGSNGQAGVIRWEDKKHGRHMHLSMPSCGSRKYFSK